MTVNLALVGLGYWGRNLARNLALVRGGRLHALCDARPDRLDQYARQYPGVRAVREFDDLLADPDVHAVVLATPPRTHHPLAKRALEAGKHVLVEKPLATSSDECIDLIRVARTIDDADGRSRLHLQRRGSTRP